MNMAHTINPFHTLYLTEGVGTVDIPSLFSPVLVPHVAPLFLPGNVVLKGGSSQSVVAVRGAEGGVAGVNSGCFGDGYSH
jgi:hypothetical protein